MSDDELPGEGKPGESYLADHARSLALSELQLALDAVKRYVSAATPQRLLRDGAALVRRQPALALGASFLLGAALARRWAPSAGEGIRPPTPSNEPVEGVSRAPAHHPDSTAPAIGRLPTFDPVAVNQAPSPADQAHPGSGSPIGDSPGAGAS